MRWLLVVSAVAAAAPAAAAPPRPDLKAMAAREVDGLSGEIASTAASLWTFSETALRETRSAALLADLLQREGFAVERAVAGMPTAFVATWGGGRPVLGILAEYDALPGVGNAPVPRKEAREDGVTSGQGCGHNLFGAGSVGAALALQRTLKASGLPGTLQALRHAGGGDADRQGVHGARRAVRRAGRRAGVAHRRPQRGEQPPEPGQEQLHGGVLRPCRPRRGRSLERPQRARRRGADGPRREPDARARQPTARVHYVIPSAGEAPNVVPAYAKVWFYVRDLERAATEEHYAWLLKIAEGAALATQTTHKVMLNTGVHEYLFNRPLQEAMQKNLEAVGAAPFTEEEQAFARRSRRRWACRRSASTPRSSKLAEGLEPPEGGSTDVAEVSRITPTVGLSSPPWARTCPGTAGPPSASHGLPGRGQGGGSGGEGPGPHRHGPAHPARAAREPRAPTSEAEGGQALPLADSRRPEAAAALAEAGRAQQSPRVEPRLQRAADLAHQLRRVAVVEGLVVRARRRVRR